ncbi:uncharacterized protein LOC111282085 isoform X2 [Durio zibethinus]|uniref:Uncharacterized protein LOC111282085 isoform X2 n=1 Tax=Durio zibethinus TaxID=66656 RepID=A0A6P5XBS8_DURZI|nr:uncharacterized protein LOC111282085 isoform X2 [Durio zibethinus]
MWFLMRLTKDEREINLANGEADPEFVEWKWELLSRAGFSSVDQFYASYPAGTELLTDTTKEIALSRKSGVRLSSVLWPDTSSVKGNRHRPIMRNTCPSHFSWST